MDTKAKNSIFQNWISAVGGVIAGASFFAFILLFAFDISAGAGNPYVGILTFIVAPAFLVLGLTLFLGGALFQHWHQSRGRPGITPFSFTLNFSNPKERRKIYIFAMGSSAFLLLTALGSYQTYHVTESVAFCGEVCHVMEPEFVTFQNAPHSHISCVDCHIGDGATNLVKAKMQGLKQVYQMVSGGYPTPIKIVPIEMRPTSETCLDCHWPGNPYGNQDRLFTHYLSDSENTPYSVRLLLKTGGGDPRLGPTSGIHWHTDPSNKVEFIVSDELHEEIPWMKLTRRDGSVAFYGREDYTETPHPDDILEMNCIDCHNRPAHQLLSPNESVDQAMLKGSLNPDWEDMKYNAVDILTSEYETKEEGMEAIKSAVLELYGENPGATQAIDELQRIYSENFFPAMQANWETYPSHIGHKNSAGCFRCHNAEYVNLTTGDPMPATDCTTCHVITAQGNTTELTAFDGNGIVWEHPDGDVSGLLCSDCHTGGMQ